MKIKDKIKRNITQHRINTLQEELERWRSGRRAFKKSPQLNKWIMILKDNKNELTLISRKEMTKIASDFRNP